MKTWFRILAVSTALAATPVSAAAQSWFVAPFLGGNMGGDTTTTSPAVGVSGGWMGWGWIGAEMDVSWAPTFFEQDGFLTERRVLTAMWNGMVTVPGMSETMTPFVSGGLGLFKPRLEEAGAASGVDARKLGWNIGGGIMATKGKVGVRGDLRYFRGLNETDDDVNVFGLDFSSFGFWRASAGLLVRF